MSLPERVIYRVVEDDYLALNALVFRRTWIRCLWLTLPTGAIIAVPIAVSEQSVIHGIVLMLVGISGASLYVLLMRLFLKPRVRRIYRETYALQEQATLFFEEGGIRVEQASGMQRAQWGQLVRWDEDEKIFALFPNRLLALSFPKQQVSTEVVDFMRDQIRLSGLPRPWTLRK
ncbi:YcxB family protein [Porphyrobacter sp. AAP82]|uniref:YcxB family protein n=1 Tax=Porphyrobacter sp. AAP82 TaxID=1248917 RepID=UPI000524E1A2|nr:YcxB family protein [Porphyrobacter sp. AAP82]